MGSAIRRHRRSNPDAAIAAAGRVQQNSIFDRRVVIPGRHAIGGRMGDVIIRACFGGAREARIAAVFVRSREAVQRPSQAARPAGIAAIALLCRLAQELAGLEIEYSFVRR